MNKRFIFGFCSPSDLLTTLFKFKSLALTFGGAALISILELAGYIYQPYQVIILLFIVMIFDWSTGSFKAFKKRTFNSFTFQRMLLNIFLTMLLIGISTHLAIHLPVFAWLKINEVLMSGFMITYLYSIIENLHAIDNKIISDKLFEYIKGALNLDTYFKRFFEPKKLDSEIEAEKNKEQVIEAGDADDSHLCSDELQQKTSGE